MSTNLACELGLLEEPQWASVAGGGEGKGVAGDEFREGCQGPGVGAVGSVGF